LESRNVDFTDFCVLIDHNMSAEASSSSAGRKSKKAKRATDDIQDAGGEEVSKNKKHRKDKRE
jgi:hypothetical protein